MLAPFRQVSCLLVRSASSFTASVVPEPGDRSRRHLRVKNYGYRWTYYVKGEPLPRIKGCMDPVYGAYKITDDKEIKPDSAYPDEKIDEFTNKDKMLLGQNDYIDLLGDGSVHPAQLLYHVPPWLRGFPGQHRANELLRMIHYRNMYEQKLKRNSPKRWHELMKRVLYLLKYNNYWKQDEIRLERKLGLWDEQPDYFHKDKTKRTFKDIH